MAVTTERGITVKVREGTSTTLLSRIQQACEVNVMPIEFTQSAAAGDATSTQAVAMMPAGKHKVLSITVDVSAFGAARTLDIGTEAFTKIDGTVVALAATFFKAALDVSSAVITTLPVNKDMDSSAGYVIYTTVAGGTIPAGATIKGYVTFI